MKEVRYGLWAMPVNDESIVFATENEFARIGDRRVLVYRSAGKGSEREIPETAVRISDEDAAEMLTEQEARWLTGCNVKVIERVAESFRAPMERTIPGFLKRLRTELENIRRATDAEEEERSKRE